MIPGARRPRLATSLLAIALVVAGCATSSTPEPGETSGPQSSDAAPGPTNGTATASRGPGATFGALPSGWPEFPELPAIEPDLDLAPFVLAEPTITEPFAIGQALYDPNRVSAAVASLLDLMGVGIYKADGTALRRGDEHDAGHLWLTADEVRGLVEMGVADARAAQADETGPYTFADLAAAVGPLLPGWSAERLASAYEGAYADHRDDLVPTILLGQPIGPTTPLTRVQLWLLYVDGFLTPGSATAIVPGAEIAQAGASWGTANAALPNIPSPDPTLTAQEWALLLAHLAVVGWTIPYEADPIVSDVHEGHDQPGPSVTVTARIDLGAGVRPLVSPVTGRTILGPRSTTSVRGSVTWSASDEGVLTEHGSLSGRLGVPVSVGPGGDASIGYQARQEPADQHGPEVSERADLRASIPVRDLVLAVYDVPLAAQGFLLGTREVTGRIRIAWHAREGIQLRLANRYGLDLASLLERLAEGSATGRGEDIAAGFLEKQEDGTFRGVVSAWATGIYDLSWAGRTCGGGYRGSQWLYVVGVPTSGDMLQLRFYPETEPVFQKQVNNCLALFVDRDGGLLQPSDFEDRIPWLGGGPDGRPPGMYLAYGNARWTEPLLGYAIHLPTEDHPVWSYSEDSESSTFGAIIWYVDAKLVTGSP